LANEHSHDKKKYELNANICKTLSNSKRLEILHLLKDGEKSVSDLLTLIGANKSNLSQHLALLKKSHLISSRRDGINIYYTLTNARILKACELICDVLKEQLKENNKALEAITKSQQ